jgi:hypothetical protein
MSDEKTKVAQPPQPPQPVTAAQPVYSNTTTGMDDPARAASCILKLAPNNLCDVLDFNYRLNYPTSVAVAGINGQLVPVEVKFHFRLTRCRGPLALGDLLYSTTLLPGEKVRLFTSDRRSKFSFDTTTKFGYRNTQSSEESFFMQQMSDSLFDVNSRDETRSSNQSHSHVDGHADAGIDIFGGGGSANMSGNFDSHSVSSFLGEHQQHAESSFHAAEMGTRKSSSTSIGESQSRTHTESESQDHYESASREFENKNQCHAVTFLFYQIDKTQTVKYTLESIDLRVILDPDPSKDFTRVAANPVAPSSGIGITSTNVLATAVDSRLLSRTVLIPVAGTVSDLTPKHPIDLRNQAVEQVKKELVKAGLLDPNGKVADAAKALYSFEKQSALPTPGVLVKGYLDDCDVCEPTLHQGIELDLEQKRLRNELLKKQIELLEESQEYRCCPRGGVDMDSARGKDAGATPAKP